MEKWKGTGSHSASAEPRAVMEAQGVCFLCRGSNLHHPPAVSKMQRKMGKTRGPLKAVRPPPELAPTLWVN